MISADIIDKIDAILRSARVSSFLHCTILHCCMIVSMGLE